MSALIRPAFYARVSSQKQANERTIESQCEVLRNQIKLDGFCIELTFEFLDDGCSGTELLRPALEKLRDCIVAGVVNRLYIHSVDRLARKMGHQLLLLDEFKKYACEVIFIKQPKRDDSPESNMLLNIDEIKSEHVKLMFDLVGNQGCSLRQVSRELAKRSIPTKSGNQSWRITTIRAILRYPQSLFSYPPVITITGGEGANVHRVKPTETIAFPSGD